jgi:hypothetical protein
VCDLHIKVNNTVQFLEPKIIAKQRFQMVKKEKNKRRNGAIAETERSSIAHNASDML